MLKIEDYREHYELYFKEFHRLAVGEYADLSYSSDKPNGTASSLESIIAYANYISKQDCGAFILNAGVGASSWIFRKIYYSIWDIDSNKRYSSFIEKLCKTQQPFTGGFNPDLLDCEINHIYYDYGNIERLPYLGLAIELANKSIYIDDSDVRDECMPYRKHVIALCEAMGLKWFDCKESLDEHGRSGIIIEK